MSKRPPIVADKDALKSTPARPLDPAALSNDQATLRALVGALNSTPRGVDPNAPVDTTKYDAPTGAANATILTDTSVDESKEAALNAALSAQRKGASQQEIVDAAKQVISQPVVSLPTPAPQQAAQPASTVIQRARRLVLTGRNIKQIAAQLGSVNFRLNADAHALALRFFPDAELDTPGFAELIATIRAWGDGEVSEKYPLTVERAMFTRLARIEPTEPGASTTANFGKPGFWTDALVSYIKTHAEANPNDLIVVSGISDITQLRFFQTLGFQHWHITGAPGAQVDPFSAQLDQDTIRVVSQQRQGAKLRAVWSEPTPCNGRLWTAKEFIDAFK